ncbi:TIGR04141 family sporadically distributed protein [Aerococcus viridans]|uniref:DUF6119 family protein n=1 Tax=Aerococcus viridans TaxID=1377 RepID=UPI0028FD502F|nr:TIGR04141 family sporadically distributed protein [Aerococcus viridans]
MAKSKEKSRSISIFLHKEKVRSIYSCLKEDEGNVYEYSEDLNNELGLEGKIFIGRTTSGMQPGWTEDLNKMSDKEIVLDPNISNRAVVIIKCNNRFFSITFGYGRGMLNMNNVVRNFGLKVAVNVLDDDKLSKLSMLDVSDTSMVNNTAQPISPLNINQMNIDLNTNIFKSIAGTPLKDNIGTSVNGSDSLLIKGKIDFNNIKSYLEEYYTIYSSNDYQKNGFGWIDNIQIEKDNEIKDKLDKKLLEAIQSESDKVIIQPNIEVEIDSIEGYYLTGTGAKTDDIISDPIKYDYYFNNVKEYISKGKTYPVKKLHNNKIFVRYLNEEKEIVSSVYHGIIFETVLNSEKYVLYSGDWYVINSDYYGRIIKNIKAIPHAQFSLPKFRYLKEKKNNKIKEREEDYNSRVSNASYILIDQKNFYTNVNNSSIEPCDLFGLEPKRFIHVKVGTESSSLSHLFNQAYVSAQTFASDSSFRSHIQNLLPIGSPDIIGPNNQNSDFEIVIAIVDKASRTIYEAIPFFSKVSLDNIARSIQTMGYRLSLLKIDVEVVDEL